MNAFELAPFDWTEDRKTVEVPHAPGADSALHVLVFYGLVPDTDAFDPELEFDILHPPVCGYTDTLTEDGSGVEYREYFCGHEAIFMDGDWREAFAAQGGSHHDLTVLAPGLYETRFWYQVGYTDGHSWGIEILAEITSEVPS